MLGMPAALVGFPIAALKAGVALPMASSATLSGLGDSRLPTFTDPATKRQKGATCLMNQASVQSDKKFLVKNGYGISGATIPTYLANLNAAIAENPGVLFFPSILNSIAAGTSGADCATAILAAVDQAIAANIVCVVMSEMGTRATGTAALSAALMAQVDNYNLIVSNAVPSRPRLRFFDVRPIVCDPVTRRLLDVMSYDPQHLNQYGADLAGASFKSFLEPFMPTNAGFVLDASGIPAVGGFTQLAPNARFATLSGGSSTTGATSTTGAFPGSCTVNKSGSAGVALSITPALENVVMNCTFGAQGDNCRMSQGIPNANWNGGDKLRGLILAEVTAGAVGLAGIELNMVASGDAGSGVTSTTYADMATALAWAGPTRAHRYLMLTQEYTLPAYTTKSSLAVSIQIRANAAGSAQVNVKQMGILKVPA